MNQQPIEKQHLLNTGHLEVHSIFRTIQGEGPFTGRPSVFIRLAGCNLACPMCDTDYTSKRWEASPDDLVTTVTAMARPHELIVITGGEPFRQNLAPLVDALLDANFKVQIETNGTLYQDLPFDFITVVCSPKAGSLNKNLIPYIDFLKYVLHADQVAVDDGLPLLALNHPAKPRLARPPESFYKPSIYLQPVDEGDAEKNTRHLQAVVESCLQFGYTLQLQIHKLLGVE